MQTRPMIRHGVFGIAERDVPQMGVPNSAVWPVIDSGRTRSGAGLLRAARRHVTWWRMLQHTASCETIELVNPPRWAAKRIAQRRARLGLATA